MPRARASGDAQPKRTRAPLPVEQAGGRRSLLASKQLCAASEREFATVAEAPEFRLSAGSLDHEMRIARELYDDIIEHARVEAPNECCGMVAARNGQAVKVYRATNAAASPLRYEIDGVEQYGIQMEIDDAGLDLGAIYHSHTRTEPYPSQTDINLAFYPDAVYVIVGLATDEPEVRAYAIRDGRVTEAELIVE